MVWFCFFPPGALVGGVLRASPSQANFFFLSLNVSHRLSLVVTHGYPDTPYSCLSPPPRRLPYRVCARPSFALPSACLWGWHWLSAVTVQTAKPEVTPVTRSGSPGAAGRGKGEGCELAGGPGRNSELGWPRGAAPRSGVEGKVQARRERPRTARQKGFPLQARKGNGQREPRVKGPGERLPTRIPPKAPGGFRRLRGRETRRG